jgi:hypothetical protein
MTTQCARFDQVLIACAASSRRFSVAQGQIWKFVLDRLLKEADAVLIDFRGFGPQTSGCVFEIEELLNFFPLGRVTFMIDSATDIIDSATDESFLYATTSRPGSKSVRHHRIVSVASFVRYALEELVAGDLRDLFVALRASVKGY